jgi:ATP-dependent helicase HrpB
VGFRVRLQSKVSARTRIEVVTEGVFTRMILDDPGLDGVAAVLFDEFHERSLDADLGLAFARDVQGVLRDDLRLLVMSATLDGARISACWATRRWSRARGGCSRSTPAIWAVTTASGWKSASVRAVERALAEESGSDAGLPAGPGRDPPRRERG